MDAAKKPRIINGITDLGLVVEPTANDTLSQTITSQLTDAFVELYKLKAVSSTLGVLLIDETRLEPDIALEVLSDNLETAHDMKNKLNEVRRMLDDVTMSINHFEQYNSKRRTYVKRRQA